MGRSTRALIGALAVAGLLLGVASEASAAPRAHGRVAAAGGGRVAHGRRIGGRGYARYGRGSNAGPAIAGAALGLIGAATAAAAASQYGNDNYYAPGSYYGGGYAPAYGGGYAPAYGGYAPGYGGGYYSGY